MPDPTMPVLSEAEQEAITETARRQRELDHTEAVARGTAAATVNQMLAAHSKTTTQAQEEERQRLAPFYAYMDSLRDLTADDQGEARTELKLTLNRLEANGGPKPTRIFCEELALDQEGVKALGDPGFEMRTMDYAKRSGRFGRYEWRMKGWAAGELTLDTTTTVTVEPPPGYVPPVNAVIEDRPKEDPMGHLNTTLDMVSKVAGLFGGGSKGGMDPVEIEKLKGFSYEQGQRSGKLEGQLEADRAHRKELDELRERHRRELDEAEQRGMARGQIEGERKVRDELTPRIWKLEHEAGVPESSVIGELVGHMGGPEAFQGLIGAVVSSLNKPKATAPQPHRQPPPAPHQTHAAPVVINPSGEPTRAEHLEAMSLVDEAAAIIEEKIPDEGPEAAAQLAQVQQMLEDFHAAGMQEGPMAAWWAAWTQHWKANVENIIQAAEQHAAERAGQVPASEESSVDLESLRAKLMEALDSGKTDEEILEGLKSTVPDETRAAWLRAMGAMPIAFVAGAIGQGQHNDRLMQLLTAFKAQQ
ncbi:hypothetical protein [Geothrix campi]|uniref:hypothetical protein n=1 Tax=Geothrix campi TaxID=2966450 RepID=UPI0021485DD7|nr:hypothetical protein [Geothrix sp. SG10]